jgi:hypothetical protein
MAPTALSRSKKPTKSPQLSLVRGEQAGPGRSLTRRAPRASSPVAGDVREGTRGQGRVVVEVDGGITVYPARQAGERWRAVWYENGQRRQCQAASEERLAVRLEKIRARLEADAPGLERPAAELIGYYLSADRHPANDL